jgi:hypothetical protein
MTLKTSSLEPSFLFWARCFHLSYSVYTEVGLVGFCVNTVDLYGSLMCDSRRSSRAGKVPLPGATSTAVASSGGAGGMSSSTGQGQDASSSSALTAAGAASANGVPVPVSAAGAAGDEHAVHHATVPSGRKTTLSCG